MDLTLKLELVIVPVSDVDRSKAFYTDTLGFALDVDVEPAPGMRIVQLTPPGSACSITIGTGLEVFTSMPPGAVKGLHLVVDGIEAAHAELTARGLEIGEISDDNGGVRYAGFADPDGNTFTLQEMAWRTGPAY